MRHAIILFLLFIATTLSVTGVVPPPEEFSFMDGQGTATSHDHIEIRLDKGWNLVPIKYLAEASGRYHANYEEGISCDQDILQNVWYYSPAKNDYILLENIDDWRFPVGRDKPEVLSEFKAQYYHAYAGSAWIRAPGPCTLAGDSGPSLISEHFSSMDGYGYSREELILKAGWNFIPLTMRMAVFEHAFAEAIASCDPQRIFYWDSSTQSWIDMTGDHLSAIAQENYADTVGFGDVGATMVVKTGIDCHLAAFEPASQAPPSLPN